MVSKASVFHLTIEEYDKLNNKHISSLDINNYLREEDNIKFYAFVLHDADINECGEKEHIHYHLVVVLNNSISKNTLINDIASKLFINKYCVQSRKVKDFILSVQYLIHKNDKDKYQYNLLDVWSNDVNELVSIIYDNVSQYDLDIDYLIELVQKSKHLADVYRTLGLKKARTYRAVIVDLWKDLHL